MEYFPINYHLYIPFPYFLKHSAVFVFEPDLPAFCGYLGLPEDCKRIEDRKTKL